MKKFWFISSAFVSCNMLMMALSQAQCVNENCAALGYTETSNTTGNCVKCPFGEAWNCSDASCPDNYKYTCDVSNQYGSVGKSCGGKYTECLCAEGYTWENGSCKCANKYACSGTGYAGGVGESCMGYDINGSGQYTTRYASCTCAEGYSWTGIACVLRCYAGKEFGYILYSDMTRSEDLEPDKTPIGVVICSYPEGGGQALALNSIGKYQWSTENVDIPEIENDDYSTVTAFSSCADTQAMLKAGDANTYPAAWAAHNYTTEGTNVGDWCLPASTVARIDSNELNFIDSILESAGGTVLGSMLTTLEYEGDPKAKTSTVNRNSYGIASKSSSITVRPVIEF